MNALPLPEVIEHDDKPINQFHAQLLRQVEQKPISAQLWDWQKERKDFEWPSRETF
jgi:hypothetical protein